MGFICTGHPPFSKVESGGGCIPPSPWIYAHERDPHFIVCPSYANRPTCLLKQDTHTHTCTCMYAQINFIGTQVKKKIKKN